MFIGIKHLTSIFLELILSIFGKKKDNSQIAANRLQRWSYFLSAYDYSIYLSHRITEMESLSRLFLDINNNYNLDNYDFLQFIQEGCVRMMNTNPIRTQIGSKIQPELSIDICSFNLLQ